TSRARPPRSRRQANQAPNPSRSLERLSSKTAAGNRMIVVLCGGVGGSRFLRALALVVPQERLTAIINTGDDEWFHGLYVSPDPDIVTYALAGEVDDERGWGLRGDTFRWLEAIARFGHETWRSEERRVGKESG